MIIGIVGPLCSGKDVTSQILSEEGFESISSGDAIRKDMKEKGIELTRENIQEFVRRMRREEGLAYPANKFVKRIIEGKDYVVSGFRNIEEVKEVKKLKYCYIVAVDAPERVRFQRMKERNREKDPVTFEEFKEIDDMEMYGEGERGFGFNIKGCIEMADYEIFNDESVEELKKEIDNLLMNLKR